MPVSLKTYGAHEASIVSTDILKLPESQINYQGPIISFIKTDLNCFGDNNGSIIVSVTGADGTESFSWLDDPTIITANRTSLTAGTYQVTVTNTSGSSQLSIDITQPAAALSSSISSQSPVLCFGGANGSVTVSAANGTAPYEYSLNGAAFQVSGTFSTLTAGSYTVTVRDAAGCTADQTVIITQPAAALSSSISSQTPVLCFGGATGSVTVSATNGTAPYEYSLNGAAFQVSGTFSTLTAGSYSVTVRDAAGCTTDQAVAITQPAAAISSSISSQTPVLCFGGATGSVTVSATNGTAPYQFSLNGGTDQPSGTFSALSAGNYTVTVKDAAGCTTDQAVTITQPASFTISTISSNTPICQGSNLNFTVAGTGGVPAYSYNWTGPNGFTSVSQNPNITSAIPAASGTYSVIVLDANSCSATGTTSVIVNPTPTAIANPAAQVICSGITTSIALTGSVPGTSYTWTASLTSGTASGFSSGSGSTIAQTLINNTAVSATVSYTITPSANGCIGSPIAVVITVNPIPIVIATPASQTLCTGGTTAINLSSGTVGTVFSWTASVTSGSASGYSNGTGNNIAQQLTNASTGQAIVTFAITPTANGCTGPSINVDINVNPNSTISLSSASTTNAQTICINTPLINISYAIGGSGNGALISAGALPSGVTGVYNSGIFTISGTPAVTGTFLYTLTTTGPCNQASASGSITSFSAPTVNAVSDRLFCSSISTPAIPLSGPVPLTTFTWTNNNVLIGLAASGTGNIPSFTATNNTVAPILAQITVTPSANGCTGTPATFTITINPLPTLNTLLSDSKCSGTLFSYTPGSLTSNTTYGWSRSAKAGISNPAATGTGNINETLTNITSNSISTTYIYTLTANGCSTIQNLIVSVVPAPTLTSTLTPSDICSNSLFTYVPTFTIAGTVATWSRAVVPNISNPIGSGAGTITETLINTSAADVFVVYTFTLNAAGCVNTQNVTVKVKASPVLSSSLAPPTICSNTTFSYSPTSSTPGTTFTWTRAAIPGINGNLPGGGSNNPNEVLINSTGSPISVTYLYTLRALTCQTMQSVVVIVNPVTTATISGTTSACLNTPNPDITFTGSGGTAPYTFTYNINGGANQVVVTSIGNSVKVSAPTSVLGAFTYNLVSVSNSNGCTQNQAGAATVTVTSLPTAAISGTTAVCQNSSTLPLVSFTGSNGSAPYTFIYTINGGGNLTTTTTSGNSIALAAPTGVAGTFIYSLVSVSSAAGCSQAQSGTATITINPLPVLSVSPAAPAVCGGGGTVLTASGASTYLWSPATGLSSTTGASVTANPATTTTYTVSGTNANGCVNTTTVTVTVRSAFAITVSPSSTSICEGGSVTLTAAGAVSYAWSPPDGLSAVNTASVSASPSVTTTYTVTGSDASGCTSTTQATVNVNAVPVLTSPLTLAHICGGSTFSYTPSATPSSGVTFSWSRPAIAGNSAASGTGSISEKLVNTTANPVSANYLYTLSTGGCSVTATVSLVVVPAPVVVVTASSTSVCAGTSINLTSSSNVPSIPLQSNLLTMSFDGASNWTTSNTSIGGPTANAAWTNRSDGYIYSGTTFHSGDKSGFMMSNSRDQGGNGSTDTWIQNSNTISTVGYSGLTLTYNHFYRDGGAAAGDNANVEYSTDGTTWIRIVQYTTTQGSATVFQNESYAIAAVGAAALRIRFRYATTTPSSAYYWAIDNVVLTGTSPSTPTVLWSSNPPGFSSTLPNPTAIVSNTTTYTATYTDPSTNCPGSASILVTGIPPADSYITADYCTVPGKIKLTVFPAPPGFVYKWSTGETTQSIQVDIVSNYTVQVTSTSTGCTGFASLPVSNELVVNGNFSSGNTGFITGYGYVTDIAGVQNELWPEKLYSVGTNANNYHTNFFGKDRVYPGTGQIMIVNGWGNSVEIWRETVPVKANANYYFSAWAASLNSVSPYAKLRFEVNGVQVGTTANLGAGPPDNTQVAASNWIRFYSNPIWNSGANTTAVIRIINLEPALNGNDFALDDISFGSLDPAPSTVAPTSNGTICAGDTIKLYSNVVGGKSPYHFTWTGPNGFTSTDSIALVKNTTAANSGTYTVSLVDGYGCAPVSGTTTAIVNALTTCLITGADTLCPSSAGHTYTAPAGMISYLWTITNGTIVGAANGQNVTVTAGAICTTPIVLKLFVKDANCSNTCTKTIILADKIAWTSLAASLNRTLECTDAIGLTNAQSLVPTATSSCTPVITPIKTSGAFVSGACPQAGTYTNSWTFKDACGNSVATPFTQIITITDTTPPLWTTAINGLDRSLSCSDVSGLTSALALSPVAGDVCSPALTYTMVSDVTTPGPCIGTFTRVRKWTAKDNCNNISIPFTQTIQVTDTLPPVWDQAPTALNGNFECGNTGGLAALLGQSPTATDGCGSGVTIALVNDNTTPGSCAGSYTRIREWTATDGCLNASARYTQTIIVSDITAPVWTTPQGELDVVLECSDATGLAVAMGLYPAASDNCDADVTNITKISGPFVAGTCPQLGSYTNTWTVTDDCGNLSAIYRQTITLEDNTAPDIVRPSDQAISCSDSSAPSATGFATATDNCDTNLTITYTDVVNPGSCPGDFIIHRTWKAIDKCGNSTTSLQQIFVQDVDPPVITCQISGNQQVNTNSGNQYLHSDSSWEATATDGCSSFTLLASLSGATTTSGLLTLNGVAFNAGVTTVTWTALDACGNQSSCTFTVTVEAGADLIITITAAPSPVILGQNLTYTITVTNLGPSTANNITVSEILPAGLTLISYTPTSGSWDRVSLWAIGNLSFNDVATLTITATTSLDHCSDFTNTVSVSSPTTDPVPTNNNASVLTQVLDATKPVIATCPESRVLAGCSTGDITGPAFSTISSPSSYTEFSDATNKGLASDNCGISNVSYQDVVDLTNPLKVLRTWTVGDAAGNESTCQQQIEVRDTTSPTFTPPTPFIACVENLNSAAYISKGLKINPDPDYYLFKKGNTSFDLDPVLNNFNDNCCAANTLIIHWRIDFTDTPNQTPPPTVLSHPSITGIGQPSVYSSDIQIPGDGVSFTSIVHTITYWLVDCNGNRSADQAVNITVNPRPNVK